MPSDNRTAASGVEAVTSHLASHGIPHRLIEHEETFTAVKEAIAAHAEPAAACKTLVLRDHDRYLVVLLPAHRHADMSRLRYLTGASRHLRLASEEEMAHDFNIYEVGATPAFGPLVPAAELVDVRLLDARDVLFAAGDHRHSVVVPTTSLVRAVEPRVADLCEVRDDIEDW